jgi:hypothetical protein
LTTEGEEIFRKNVTRVRHEIGGRDVAPVKAALVEIVRSCLAVRRPPTFHRRVWLERHSPSLLAYLDEIADTNAWQTLTDRVRATSPDGRGRNVWLGRIAGTLHDVGRIGQAILDRNEIAQRMATLTVLPVAPSGESGDGGSGDAGQAGKAGTVARPVPAPPIGAAVPRLRIPMTDAERRALGLEAERRQQAEAAEAANTASGDGPDGTEPPTLTMGGPKK